MANRKQRSPTFWVSFIIIAAVSAVIVTLLYNAISQKREFDEEQGAATQVPASAPQADSASSSPAAVNAPAAPAAASQ